MLGSFSIYTTVEAEAVRGYAKDFVVEYSDLTEFYDDE